MKFIERIKRDREIEEATLAITQKYDALIAAIQAAQSHTTRDAQQQATTTWSFDMLGEGARNWADADRYLAAYEFALNTIAQTEWYTPGPRHLHHRPGLSIKLSALHPRFEAPLRQQVIQDLIPRLMPLVRLAAGECGEHRAPVGGIVGDIIETDAARYQ